MNLHEAVAQELADHAPQDTVKELEGVYFKLFRREPSTMQIERVVHVSIANLAQAKQGSALGLDTASGQRFVYNFEPHEVSFGFAVVEDGDPRAGCLGTDREPTILDLFALLFALKVGEGIVPWRRSDLSIARTRLLQTFRDLREENAAAIFNKATTYDALTCGDGRAVCSEHHPFITEGTLSNLFAKELSSQTLEDALLHIKTTWADSMGVHIKAEGRRLVVPRGLSDTAAKINFPTLVWDQLTNPRAWFVTTTCSHSLVWFERDPFELDTWQDHEKSMVLVRGYERRCFGCSDPRAILGSFPA